MKTLITLATFASLSLLAAAPAHATLPLSTQTFLNASGKVQLAPHPQPIAQGYSPQNGARTSNGFTVFNNRGGAGTAMDARGNMFTGRFDIRPNSGHSVFLPTHAIGQPGVRLRQR